jgi:hypothetical protein
MDPADALRRWIASGGHWEVLAEHGDEVTVGLFTCDGGEEMDRLVLRADQVPTE